MLAHIKDIIAEAQKRNYAIGAFNVHNFETIMGVASAAKNAGSPAIIQVSEGAIRYMGLKPITHIVSTVAKNLVGRVPIALHLDHGKSLDVVIECIDAGFSSVHIDASHLPLDENIKITRQIVEFAHGKNVWVQGEVGAMVGGHGMSGDSIEIPLADLDEVVEFVKETKVDTIAAAIGTAHGTYKNEKINFDLLRGIKEKAQCVFVLHGGSGVENGEIRKAIKEGVDIVNIGTDIKTAFCQTLIKNCRENSDETDPRKLLKPTIDAVKEVVIEKMKVFGSYQQVFVPKMQT